MGIRLPSQLPNIPTFLANTAVHGKWSELTPQSFLCQTTNRTKHADYPKHYSHIHYCWNYKKEGFELGLTAAVSDFPHSLRSSSRPNTDSAGNYEVTTLCIRLNPSPAHLFNREGFFHHNPYTSHCNHYLMRIFGFLCCACPEATPDSSATPDSRNIYLCDLDTQYSSLQVEEIYLRRKYLERRKTVSFAEDFCMKKPSMKPRKAVTSILKSPRRTV